MFVIAREAALPIGKVGADQYPLRMPHGMRERLKRNAAESHRSLNSEIIFILEKALGASASTAATGSRLDPEVPVAASDTTALAGGDIANPANGVP